MEFASTKAVRRKARSLQTLTIAVIGLLGLLTAGLVISFQRTSRTVWDAMQKVAPAVEAVVAGGELDRVLREHARLTELWGATRDPTLVTSVPTLEPDAQRLLHQMDYHVEDAREARLLADLLVTMRTYFDRTAALLEHGSPSEEKLRELHSYVERALATNAAEMEINANDLQRARSGVERSLKQQQLLANVTLLAFAIGLTIIVWGVRRYVLHPISNLQRAIRRFRDGELEVRAAAGPLSELRELAEGFDDMAATIAQKRRDQLTFLAAVAHDLRNPLAALKMTVQAVARGTAQTTPERFKRLDAQLDQLTRMVGDLLDATRIEAGQLELKTENFDLRHTVHAMVDLYSPTSAIHHLISKVPEHPVFIHGDPLRIEQVVSNLLSNAIKYSPAGGLVEVSVSEDGGWAELSVSDQGSGIAPGELEDVFLPFRRQLRMAANVPGVGLGLSIVRRIVIAHGGEVWVESVLEKGSTFRVRLPLAPHAPEEKGPTKTG